KEGNAPLAPLGKAQRGPRFSHEGNAPLAPLGKAQRGPRFSHEGNAPLAPLGKAQRGPRFSHEGNAPLAPLGKAQWGPTPRGLASLGGALSARRHARRAARPCQRPARPASSRAEKKNPISTCAVSNASEPWAAFFSTSVPKSFRTVPASAFAGSVAPRTPR